MAHLIVIAEDDHDVADTVSINLELEGFDVHVAHDGRSALERTLELRPDLVVLDVVLGDIDGYAVCEALRADPRTASTPVVMLSARCMPSERVRGFAVGADDFIPKPYDPAELIARVNGLLRRASRALEISPVTGMPGPFQIDIELTRRLAPRGRFFAVVAADLNGFRPFNARYGFERGDDLLRFTAAVLTGALLAHGGTEDFAGYAGDDFFVLLTAPERAAAVCRAAIDAFDAGVGSCYDAADAERGYVESTDRKGERHRYPLVSLALGVASNEQRGFGSGREALDVAWDVQRHAKRVAASAYEVDRRGEV